METSLQLFSNILSLITIGICFILKIPQIISLMSVKSSREISLFGLGLELTSYTIMTSYNFTNGYALLSYLEYPIILLQEYILIYLALKYQNKVNSRIVLFCALYFIIFIFLLLEFVPKIVLTVLVPVCTPISASSKIFQLIAIIRAKNAESISTLTWLISTFTNFTRIFTIWMDSADIMLLANCITSTSLSASIMFSVIYYRGYPKKD